MILLHTTCNKRISNSDAADAKDHLSNNLTCVTRPIDGEIIDSFQPHIFCGNSVALSCENDTDSNAVRKAEEIALKCLQTSSHLLRYQFLGILGYGSFGVVLKFKIVHQMVAVKVFLDSQIAASQRIIDPQTGQPTISEIAIAKFLPHHPNIIRYRDSWFENGFWFLECEMEGFEWQTAALIRSRDNKHLFVFKDRQFPQSFPRLNPQKPNDRSLAGLLRACGGLSNEHCPQSLILNGSVIPEYAMKIIFKQIVLAVKTLHSNGIFHRDLKDENVLVDESFQVKLIDFGHASFFGQNVEGSFGSYGTSLFAPPEVRSGMRFHGPEADIYALGLMFYEAHYGNLPDNLHDARYAFSGNCIFRMDPSTGFTDVNAILLCQRMLCPNPIMRATIDEVCESAWLSNFH